MEEMKDYGHFHCGMHDPVSDRMPELDNTECNGKHIVDDPWCEFGNDCHEVLGEFDKFVDALKFVYKKILEKYPKAEMMSGAGCPLDVLLEEIKKEIKEDKGHDQGKK